MKRLLKKISIPFLFLIFTFLFFYWLYLLFFKKIEVLPSDLIFFLIFLFLAESFFIFSILALPKFPWLVFLYFFISYGIFLFFGFDLLIKIAALFFFLFLLFGFWVFQDERKSLVKFSFSRTGQKGVRHFFTGIGVLIATLGFLSPKILGGEITFPPALFDFFWPQIEKILKIQYPEISKETTIDEFLLFQILKVQERNMTSEGIDIIQKISPGLFLPDFEKWQEKEAIEKLLEAQKQRISQMISKKIKGDEKIKDLLYETLASQISKLIKPYEGMGKAGIIFVFFLIARFFLTIYFYLTFPFLYFLFIILKKVRIFEVKKEKVEKEEIVI